MLIFRFVGRSGTPATTQAQFCTQQPRYNRTTQQQLCQVLQSRHACKVAFSHPTGRSSTSAVCCRRLSQGCQPPTPGQLALHVASWHKQHLQTATSVPLANSRRAQQVPAAPSRHSPSGCDGPDADTRGISGVQPVQLHSTMVFALSL